MGFDTDGIRILGHARMSGVDFRNTCTLGRQKIHAGESKLKLLLEKLSTTLDWNTFIKEHHSNGRFAETFLKAIGAETVRSLDADSFEGASTVHDLNLPVPDSLRGRFTALIDGGCIEHVFNVAVAMENAARMLSVDGHFIGLTIANNFCGHGFYQFSPELFFRFFSSENGFESPLVLMYEANCYDRARYFEVPDPARLGRRVDIVNGHPLYLAVIARKVRDVEDLSLPYQHDYVEAWGGKSAPAVGESTSVRPPQEKAKWRQVLGFLARMADASRLPIVGRPSFGHPVPDAQEYELKC